MLLKRSSTQEDTPPMSFTPPAWFPTADQLAFLQTVDSPTVANAIETISQRDRTVGFLGGAVRALFPHSGVMVGQALTVKVANRPGPVAGRDDYWAMWEALAAMPGPSVVVMQDASGAPSRCAYAGEIMATLAQRLGAVGMVTDAGFRDVDQVRALGMHYYAAFRVVSHGNFEILDVGDPVTVDGEPIATGDLLHGDGDGIVVIPADALERLPDAVARIRDREQRFLTYLRSDRFNLPDAKAGTGY
jgi:regulator of RNase E activity RraA